MKNAVIGYDLLPKYWGKGFSTEAVHRIVKAAFSGDLSCGKLNRIQGDTVLGNSASESLLLKVGFKEEGIRRNRQRKWSQFPCQHANFRISSCQFVRISCCLLLPREAIAVLALPVSD